MTRVGEDAHVRVRPVTAAEYQAFLDDLRQMAEPGVRQAGPPGTAELGQPDAPVRGVRLSDALAFVDWARGIVPTEWRLRLPFPAEMQDIVAGIAGLDAEYSIWTYKALRTWPDSVVRPLLIVKWRS